MRANGLRLGCRRPVGRQNLAQGGGQQKTRAAGRRFWRSAHGANILSRLWFFHREIQAMRDSKTFLSAVALVAALVVSAVPAAAQTGRIGGTGQGRPESQPLKGATVTAENPQRVALVVHGDDRRQGPLLDHRPQDRHVEGHGGRRRASRPRPARCRCAASARRCRRLISRWPPAPPARPARSPA